MKSFLPLNLLLLSLVVGTGWAQNVAINATGAAPAASAMLDVSSTTSGMLIPRMTTAQRTAIAGPVQGLLVYDTSLNVFYYYDGTIWVPILANPSSTTGGWSLTGNAGTNAGTNFLGTTDAVDLVIRTNNVARMRILAVNGRIGINTAAPVSQLHSVAANAAGNTAVTGSISSAGAGHLAYFNNIALGAYGTLPSALVYADESAAGNSPSLVSRTMNPASYAAAISYSDIWIAGFYGVDNAGSTFNPPGLYGQLNVTNGALGGFQIALRGYMNRGTTAGNPGYSIGTSGFAISQNQDAFGVMGQVYCGTTTRAGGYFDASDYAGVFQSYAYVGTTVGGVARKITGTAAVSEIIPTENHGRVMLTCPESPEYWYQDYGTVQLVNGKAHVELDPIMADIVVVNDSNPIRVFCTPVNMLYFNGVAVVNQTATGFDLVELNGGTHSGTLDYQIVVKPKTGYGEGRFPQAPGPAYAKADKEPAKAKAANQPSKRQIFYWPPDHVVYGYDPAEFCAIGDVVPAGPHAGKIKVGPGQYSDKMPLQVPKR